MCPTEEKRSWLRRIGAIVVILAVMAAAVWAVSFALCPYGTKSQVSWSEFRKQENLDAVCIGTSLAERAYDPDVVDSALGTHSFNMCTPIQSLEESYVGLMEAVEHHDIKRVYFGIDYWALWTEQSLSPGRPYLTEKWKGDDFFQRFVDLSYVLDGFDWMLDVKSINWLFPWIEQRVHFGDVPRNIEMQLDGTSVIEAAEINEEGMIYVDRGFVSYHSVYDYNASHHTVIADQGLSDIKESNLKVLADICDYCEVNDIEFIAFVPPMIDYNFISLESVYPQFYAQMKEFVESHGGQFYDLNLAYPEVFEVKEYYFADHEHCNFEGADAFSKAFADLLKRKEAGEDVNDLFMTYGEKLASMDVISIATLKSRSGHDGIELEASCYAGSTVIPEYQFLIAGEGEDFKVVQDYSSATSCTYDPGKNGVYRVRVNVRQKGSDLEFEKYTEHEVVHSKNKRGR